MLAYVRIETESSSGKAGADGFIGRGSYGQMSRARAIGGALATFLALSNGIVPIIIGKSSEIKAAYSLEFKKPFIYKKKSFEQNDKSKSDDAIASITLNKYRYLMILLVSVSVGGIIAGILKFAAGNVVHVCCSLLQLVMVRFFTSVNSVLCWLPFRYTVRYEIM